MPDNNKNPNRYKIIPVEILSDDELLFVGNVFKTTIWNLIKGG